MDTLNNTLFYLGRPLGRSGVSPYWKCDSVGSLIAIVGILAVFSTGINEIIKLNPNAAWMGSYFDANARTCVNITCGGYYCDFAQPRRDGCERMPVHLEKNERIEICTPAAKCDWEAKVVTDADYGNRSNGLWIYENTTGTVKQFPQVENFKHQYVDLVKYENSQFGTLEIDWDLQTRAITTKMESCDKSITNSRCGAYTIYFAKTIYEFSNKQRYGTELKNVIFFSFLQAYLIVKWVQTGLHVHGAVHSYRDRIRGDKNK